MYDNIEVLRALGRVGCWYWENSVLRVQPLWEYYCRHFCKHVIYSLFFFLDLKIKRCGDIWSMMNSYQDVPYIYQNNLLSEKNKIMGVHYFRKFSLIVVPLLEIQGIPLEHPLPHDGRKKLEEKPLDCSLQSFHNCRFQLMGQLDL